NATPTATVAPLSLHDALPISPDEPLEVRVDGRTGEVFPVPVAENEAFRVFTPAPQTVLGNSFTVEGQARVFEAAFTWQLEDGHIDRKSTRLNSSHVKISYAVF